MSSYETEHARDEPRQQDHRRPDMSSLRNILYQISTSESGQRTREHAVPTPGDMREAHILGADTYRAMLGDSDGPNQEILEYMMEVLSRGAEEPSSELKGVNEEYIAALERVNVKKLKKDADCPICGNAFSEDPHPLIVRLPCHQSHIFDLECISPWLQLNGTCPLDRVNLAQRERERKEKLQAEIKKNQKPEDEDEEEWDGMYS